MRIALTGGTGFIGQALLRDFAAEHSFVVYTSRDDTDGLFQADTVTYVTSRSGCDAPYEGLEACEAAVNLGFRRPVSGRGDSFADYLPSVLASDAFFSRCREHGITNVVHVSSRSVYGKELALPHTEAEPALPFSNYGAAKAAVEAIASAYNARGPLAIKVLRLAQVIGRNEYQGVVCAFMRAIEAGRPLQIWGAGDETSREYLYVRDAGAAIMRALRFPAARGLYNVGSGRMVSASELAGMLADIAGSRVTVERHPERQVERVDYLMSSEKIRREFGWSASWPIERALRAMLQDTGGLY